MIIKKKLLGKPVLVKFLDHTKGGSDVKPARCGLFGRLKKINENHIVVETWESYDDIDDVESFCVLISTISEITELKEV